MVLPPMLLVPDVTTVAGKVDGIAADVTSVAADVTCCCGKVDGIAV